MNNIRAAWRLLTIASYSVHERPIFPSFKNHSIDDQHIVKLRFAPHIKYKQCISRKNNNSVKIMIRTQVLLWKIIGGNRRSRVRVQVRVKFLLFYFQLAPTDQWCNMLQTLLRWKKCEEEMSDEHPLRANIILWKNWS